jgi:hypothetical protein
MRPYVKADCVKTVVLWNPVNLGYAAVYVMRAIVDGKLKPGDTTVDVRIHQGQRQRIRLLTGGFPPAPSCEGAGCVLAAAAADGHEYRDP